MRYTILVRQPSGAARVVFDRDVRKEAAVQHARQLKRTFPEWQVSAYRVDRARNVEVPVFRA